MKKHNLLFLLILFLFSCKKDDTQAPNPDDDFGLMIVSQELSASYTIDQMRTIFSYVDPEMAKDVVLLYDVDIYKIVYKTKNPHGELVNASGVVLLPKSSASNFPVLSFQHGTILKKTEAPSTAQFGKEGGLVFAARGYITALPDFIGLGTGDGIHPYMHSESEASATIDMIRAAKATAELEGYTANEQLFLIGYSQGGHATMATLKMIEEKYSNEFSVTATAPMAGPYDVSGVMFDIMSKKLSYNSPGYAPYILFSYDYVYNLFDDINTKFVTPYDKTLQTYFTLEMKYTMSELSTVLPESNVPLDILTEAARTEMTDKNGKLFKALQLNDLYDWKPNSPVHIYHCDADSTVPYKNSQIAYDSFISKGAKDIELINPFPGGDHSSCAVPSVLAALEWFDTLKK